MSNYIVTAICQNCHSTFNINKYYLKQRQSQNRVFCKECAKKIMLEEADYNARHKKAENTCIARYGVSNTSKLKEVQEKIKATNLKKYGKEHVYLFGSSEFKNNIQNKYGVDNVAKLDWIVSKRESTLKERTGYEHALQVPEFYKKASDTCRKRYNCTLQERTLGTVSSNRVIYNDIHFDSLWELSYFLYCKQHNINIVRNQYQYYFEYTKEGTIHKYYPDFYLPDTQEFIEIKGDCFIDSNGNIIDFITGLPNLEKAECVKKNAKILLEEDLKSLGIKFITKTQFLEMVQE